MTGVVGIGTIAGGGGVGYTLDAGYLASRVANLLRRSDLDTEILHWLTFVQRDLAKSVKFSGLRTTGANIALTTTDFLYNLPTDFSQPDRFFYRNTTDASNIWGRSLIPLPRKYYAGDVVDLERLLNVSVPSTGDPLYYWIEGAQIGIYPILAAGLTGVIQPTYYKIPPDLTTSTDVPSINADYRHYLIWLTYYWGAALLEKDDMTKVAYWEKKYEKTVERVQKLNRISQVSRETIEEPSNGMRDADGIY